MNKIVTAQIDTVNSSTDSAPDGVSELRQGENNQQAIAEELGAAVKKGSVAPVVQVKRVADFTPMEGVVMEGFEIGDRIKCDFPADYTKADKRNAKNDCRWGESAVIIGFRENYSPVFGKELVLRQDIILG
jgi:hypothetical protein